MDQGNLSRRGFLQRSFAALTIGAGLPAWYARELLASDQQKAAEEKKAIGANDRINIGVIGLGPPPRRALDLYHGAKGNKQVQFVATCNVDAGHLKFAIEEMKKGGYDAAGYKGQALVKVAKGTDRVFQVGSQQRSEGPFRLACELVRNGRVGRIKTVETRIGGLDKNHTGPFKKVPVPEGLDWEFWQGPTAKVDYIKERCHYEFRWWYEYSGGKMTDWGAHHNDIAQWGLGMDESGPISVEGTGEANTHSDCYNVHSSFTVKYKYASGAELNCANTQLNGAIDPREDKYTDKDGKEKAHRHDNGVLFRGEDDKWIFVNREIITASDKKLIDEPLPKDAVRLYPSTNHMGNFLDCLKTRKPTTCTAEIGHRSVTVCHMGVIALRTGKKLKWDPVKEVFDDAEANKLLSRPMEKPWQLDV
jgi:predicted dehydrogenase